MPMMLFEQADPTHLRTYYEKRDLVDARPQISAGRRSTMREWVPKIADMTRAIAEEFRPFDYGRFEFRSIATTGRCDFLEVNLQANLWSEKVFGRSAARAGLSQAQLIETILYEGLRRHGLLDDWRDEARLTSSSSPPSATAGSIRSPPRRASPTNAWCRSAAGPCSPMCSRRSPG